MTCREPPQATRASTAALALWWFVILSASPSCEVHEDGHEGGLFPIEGAHTRLSCDDCHGDWSAIPAPRCEACHEDDRPDPHWQETCDQCHSQDTFEDLEYEHGWVRDGAHVDLTCAACHTGTFDGASDTCRVCHADDIPMGHTHRDCGSCHGTTEWDPPVWDHPIPLEGGHDSERTGCVRCHSYQYEGTSTACEDCHALDAPVGHYDGDCGDCHTIDGW